MVSPQGKTLVAIQQQQQQHYHQEQMLAALPAVSVNPLAAALPPAPRERAALPAPVAAGQWTRHQDEKDVWYSNGVETVWQLPPGASLSGE